MILVDNQSGSRDLFPFIQKVTADCLSTRLDPPFADIAWYGNGPDGCQVKVGIEYKTIDDVMACIGDGRHVAQVAGMVENYDRRYLLIEGRLRTDRNNGNLQKLRGDRWQDIVKGGRIFTARDLEHWKTTIEEQAQFRVHETYDKWESARWVVNKWSWWTAKGYDEHSSLKMFHVPPPPAALFAKPNLMRLIAKDLPKIGWDKSIAVCAKFKTIREMINAGESTWREIDGIGEGIAKLIVDAVKKEWW